MQLKQDTELQNGKYRIIRVLGQGGFGITYLAENVFFGKTVAIKEFFPKNFCGRNNTSHLTLGTANNAETVEKLRNRFMKEAKNIAKLDHSGIVKIHDIFEENNTAYYVMDYIDGENLNEMVKRNGPLSETKAIEYIRDVGDALDYIHSRNMTHFDVKPANIVVRKSDDMPILIDFGLSKQYDIQGDATSTLMQGVSNGYSPIELYNMGSITTFSPQTDVYSLGATFYFLLTGNTPPTSAQLLEEGLNLPTDISEANQSAIRKAMSASRANRPQSINVFLNLIPTPRTTTAAHSYSNNTSSEEDTIIINPQPESPKPTHKPTPQPEKPKPTPLPDPKPESNSLGKFLIWLIIAIAVVLLIVNIGKCSTQNESNYNNTIMDSSANISEEVTVEEVVVDSPFYSEPITSEPIISSDAQKLKNSHLIDFYGYGYQIKYPSCLQPKESTDPDQKVFNSDFLAIDIRRFENSDYDAYQEWIGYSVNEYVTSDLIYEHESGTTYYYSGYNGSVIVYGKIALKNSVLYSVVIYYNQDVKDEMDKLIPQMLRNFPN